MYKWKKYKYFRLLLGLPKSLYLNIKYFGTKGFSLPILVTRKTKFKNLAGNIKIETTFKFGMIKIGFAEVPMSSGKKWNVWNVSGNIIFKGTASFGVGSSIVVGNKGQLTIGNNFQITTGSDINCFHKITIGNDVLFSWDILVMDTDAHPIRNEQNEIINHDKPISIGNNCWVGCRSMILKGTDLSSNTIVASSSVVNKEFNESNIIIAGQPAAIVKKNIIWEKETFSYT